MAIMTAVVAKDVPAIVNVEQHANVIRHAAELAPSRRTSRHRIGMDLDYDVSMKRVRLEGGTELFLCRDCESYGWVLNSPGESKVFNVFRTVLADGRRCQEGVVLDIGANEGFFGLLAAAWGCTTYIFEPQPSCIAHISAAVLINGISHVVKLIPAPVGPENLEISVSPTAHCAGQYPRRNGDAAERFHPIALHRRTDVRLVKAVLLKNLLSTSADSRPILLVKIDVEGGEVSVVASSLDVLCSGKVLNIVMEISPAWWAEGGSSVAQALQVGRALENCGFRLQRMRGVRVPPGCTSSKGVPCRADNDESIGAWKGRINPSFSAFLANATGQQDVWLTKE